MERGRDHNLFAHMAAAMHHPSESDPPTMHPMLLMAARFGDTQRLKDLLDGESSSVEVEAAAHHPESDFVVRVVGPWRHSSAATLLQGVTAVDGDSALHLVAAARGDDGEESATAIHDMAGHLLFTPSRNGDTPLHRAARAGNARMVSHLIGLATASAGGGGEGIHGAAGRRVRELLRAENELRETALHEAVRAGHGGMVVRLMEEDSELAGFPKDGGASPLYLAVVLGEVGIARSLHDLSDDGNLSYRGPNGQNALHAAVLRGEVMTDLLLSWNKDLTEQGDHDGCTPLHFAASQAEERNYRISPHSKFPWIRFTTSTATDIPLLLLQTNPCSAYQPDDHGSFPIHVAAAVGANRAVSTLLHMFPDIAGLRDAKGRTFLHVSVEKKRYSVVKQACKTPSLGWILNMQDKDGNTALHLAVKAGDSDTFFHLFKNREVRMDLTNHSGQTCRDLSLIDIPPGLSYKWNPKQMIHRALTRAGASHGVRRWDQFEDEHVLRPRREDEEKESEKLNNSTQTLGISSVLIATVTFGAAFAVPGGNVADDHANGGAPTLAVAGRPAFGVFAAANALAFVCASLGTVGLMYSGTTTVDLPTRQRHFLRSLFFVSSSLTSFVVAFASGAYAVLAPVDRSTAVAICVISLVVVVYRSAGRFQRMYPLARPLYVRAGVRPLLMLAKDVFTRMLRLFWPFIVIFSWAAWARNHT